MHLTGPGIWGPPPDPDQAIALLRLAYEWGVRIFDSAWYYGPNITHQLLAEAFSPYPSDLVLITKAGNSRTNERGWAPALGAEALRNAIHNDLRLLRLDSVPLALLRWQPRLNDDAAFLEALSVMVAMRESGKIDRLGLSNIELHHLQLAQSTTSIEGISNAYSIRNQHDTEVLTSCAENDIPYFPYYPLLGGEVLARSIVQKVARELSATPAQVAIAWLRAKSPVIVPIPGTSRVKHLKENIEAYSLVIPEPLMNALTSPPVPPDPPW